MPVSSLPQTPQVLSILGLPVHEIDMPGALACIDHFIHAGKADGETYHVVTADASMLVIAQRDARLRAILDRADLITPDSAGVLWAAKKQGRQLAGRVSGVEIVEQLCARSAEKGYRLYFLGAGPGIARQAAERMRAKYPGAQVVGVRHGYFSAEETDQVLEEIRAARADVLCVAFGIPLQEKWIADHRSQLGVSVALGVGGTLDVLSGSTRRAPALLRRLRLEWLWRTLANPRKIRKALLLPQFVRLVQVEARQARHSS